MKFVAIKQYKDGGQTVMEYFNTREECVGWISKQPKSSNDLYYWVVGEY